MSWAKLMADYTYYKIDDHHIALDKVQQNGLSLKIVSDNLRNDPLIVSAAVRKHGRALEYASHTLQSDRDIVIEAVRQNGRALEFASDDLHDDPKIVIIACCQHHSALSFASQNLRANPDFMLTALKHTNMMMFYACDALRIDREFVMNAVQQNCNALYTVGQIFQSDYQIVMSAVRQNKRVLQITSDKLRMDDTFLAACDSMIALPPLCSNCIVLNVEHYNKNIVTITKMSGAQENWQFNIEHPLTWGDLGKFASQKIANNQPVALIDCNDHFVLPCEYAIEIPLQ